MWKRYVLEWNNKIEVSFDESYSRINITADGQEQIKIDSKCKIFKYWNKVKVSGHVKEVLEIAKNCS